MNSQKPTIKPIIFNDLMVQALRSGRKFQTRRPLNPQPEVSNLEWIEKSYTRANPFETDYLWVRECFFDMPASSR